jgi:hypothetical protein
MLTTKDLALNIFAYLAIRDNDKAKKFFEKTAYLLAWKMELIEKMPLDCIVTELPNRLRDLQEARRMIQADSKD